MIRKARIKDSESIHNIAEKLHIDKISDTSKGFLVYVLPEKEYVRRIKSSDHFYVSENNNKIDGFLMCYDNNTLKDMQNKGILAHEDGIMNFVKKMHTPYIFGDQIAVDPDTQEKGIGGKLWGNLLADMKKKDITTMYVAILHKPIKNIHSINYHKKFGITKVSEVKNKDNKIWGIYKFSI
jgi:N-acetylglutamate synthase-like GNAT family acetyltransferase